MSFRLLPLAGALALAFPFAVTAPAAHAQSTPAADAPAPTVFDLQRVTITATQRGPLSARSVLASVDAAGGEAVQAHAADGNWSLFARLPGLQLTPFNQGTTTGKVSMRGFNGEGEVNAVKLLIDGVPSNSNDGNMPYLDLVPPLGLAAIQAVRGTNDARFGLHGFAGNLELVTREGGQGNEVRATLGPWGTADVQLAADREADGLTANLALGLRHTDGWRRHSASDRRTLSARWTWRPEGQDWRATFAVRLLRHEAEEPGYLTAAQVAADRRQMSPVSATDGGERFASQVAAGLEGGLSSRTAWRVLAYANRFADQRFVRFSASASQQERDTDELHQGLRATVSWRAPVSALHALVLEGGADTERQDNASQRHATTARVRTAQTRDQRWTLDTTGAFVQAVVQPVAALKLVPGWRVDRIGGHFEDRRSGVQAGVNDFGSISQPKLSVVWGVTPAWDAYANWGRTFQIGVGAASFLIPPRTTDLKPSVNDGSEVGVTFRGADELQARVALWRQTATDEVYRDLNNPSGDSVNIGATRRRGVDLQLRGRASATVDAHLTLGWQEAVITTPNPAQPLTQGKEVDHVPRQLFTAGLDWQARPDLRVSTWLHGQGSYWLERTNSLTGKYGAHRTFNAGVTWQADASTQWEARVLNLTNTRREYVWWSPNAALPGGGETLHSPGEPIALQVSLRASF
jgi:iron complex outermembrane receptor protein